MSDTTRIRQGPGFPDDENAGAAFRPLALATLRPADEPETIDGHPVRIIEFQGQFKAWTGGAWTYAWGPTPEEATARLSTRTEMVNANSARIEAEGRRLGVEAV